MTYSDDVSRRRFVRDLAALSLSGTVLTSCARTGATGNGATMARSASRAVRPGVDGIGLQLYTVSDQLRTDFDGAIEKVAQIGYRQVEFAGYFNKTPEQVRALLDRLKLKSPSSHIGMDLLRRDLEAQIQIAQTIGHEYITIPSLGRSETPMNTVDAWKRIADECNAMGQKVQSRGLKLAFHSHSGEFVSVGNGKTGMDVFVTETDPSLFSFQLDLGWARVASQDPVAWFKRYPNRFRMWHVKDFNNLALAQSRETESLKAAATATASPAAPPNAGGRGGATPAAGAPATGRGGAPGGQAPTGPQPGRPTAVGTGDIDFKPILSAWKESGMEYFFIEHDGAASWPGGSMAAITTSYQNLRRVLA